MDHFYGFKTSLLVKIEPPIFIVHAEEGQVLGDEGRAPGRQQDDPVAVARRGRQLIVALNLKEGADHVKNKAGSSCSTAVMRTTQNREVVSSIPARLFLFSSYLSVVRP